MLDTLTIQEEQEAATRMLVVHLERLADTLESASAEGIEDGLITAAELADGVTRSSERDRADEARTLAWALHGLAVLASTSEPSAGWRAEVSLMLRRAQVLDGEVAR